MDSTTTLYVPLSDPPAQIRLLRILPTKHFNDPLVCQLETASLDESQPYEALSWCWGLSEDMTTIEVNGRQARCRSNLEVALRHFRYAELNRTMWVDAICINQDATSEKNRQVPLMGSIYRQAHTVRIWLGEDDQEAEEGATIMNDLIQYRTLSKVRHNSERLTAKQFRSLTVIFINPYFERIWLMQEVILARKAVFHYGRTTFQDDRLDLLYSDIGNDGSLGEIHPFQHLQDQDYKVGQSPLLSIRRLLPMSNCMIFATVQEKTGRDCLNIFLALSALKATDPRDKIYGCPGLMPEMATELLPDYRLPVETVYVQATQALMKKSGVLGHLSYVKRSDRDSTSACKTYYFPSWALDFSQTLWKARPLWPSFSVLPRKGDGRGVSGYPILRPYDAEAAYEEAALQASELREMLRQWRSFFGVSGDSTAHSNYIGGGSLEAAFWRTIVCNLSAETMKLGTNQRNYNENQHVEEEDYSNFTTSFRKDSADAYKAIKRSDIVAFRKWLYDPSSSLSSSWHPDWPTARAAEPYRAAIYKTLANDNTHFFRTKRGYMGVTGGQNTPGLGDKVYFIPGDVPFILEPTNHETYGKVFKIVSECYVHGIMKGEAFEQPDPESKKWKKTELRASVFGGPGPDSSLPVGDWEAITLI